MDIVEIRTYEVPNIFSLREPIVKMKVSLGELAEVPTKDISGLNENIMRLFPGVADHKCATGYVGGFVDRLKEGTYLAHVTEHLCLELQRQLGHDLRFGKARQIEGGLYNVIYACPNTTIGKACGEFIVNLLNRLIEGNKEELENNIKALKDLCAQHDLGPSTGAIVREAKNRGIPVNIIENGKLIRLGYGKYQKYISSTLYEGSSSIAVDIACDKSLTKAILTDFNIPIPKGKVSTTAGEAIRYAQDLGYPVVVKPKNGNHGKHVYIGISNDDELKEAFSKAVAFEKEVMIEKYITGRDYRLLVVNGKLAAAAERIPAHVTGDGTHNVRQLIDIVNNDEKRGDDHEKPLTKIKIDDQTLNVLKKQGIDLSYIPSTGQTVKLKETANLSTGGAACDCTDIVHPRNKEIAELAARAVGLDIAGIDMVIPDIRNPIDKEYGAIVEVNAAPGIRMHLYPTKGEMRNVAVPILDMICPAESPCSVPIVAITGTNGKTTTTRMISRILMKKGFTVGTTTTHGIYINGKCIEEGDTTGPCSAKRILYDRWVEAAVLETARGGIIREGLAYEKADVAVFTNLTEDHLGIDEVHTMDDLLKAKSLVIEAVKDSGTSVLNADDPYAERLMEKARGNIMLFSREDNNPLLMDHIRNGGSAVYVKNNDIYVRFKGSITRLLDIDEIPATLNGSLKHNVYNSMAAIGACIALGVSPVIIRKVLREFSCDVSVNPGRFNIYDMGEFKVVLDYGHNIDGYKVTIEGLKKLNPNRLIGIIRVPGDRLDDAIINIGKIAGSSFDYIFVKEDKDLLGRQPLEVAKLLYKGALTGGITDDQIEIIPDETEALRKALQQAENGDVIAVFFEKMEPLIEIISENKTKSYSKESERDLLLV